MSILAMYLKEMYIHFCTQKDIYKKNILVLLLSYINSGNDPPTVEWVKTVVLNVLNMATIQHENELQLHATWLIPQHHVDLEK